MHFTIIENNGTKIAEATTKAIIIQDAQEALELLMNFVYQGVDRMLLHAENLHPLFFDLQSGLAGEVLQKFSNYQGFLAVVGDFSVYGSKSLQDFIFESNKQGRIVFVPSKEEAIRKLSHT